MNVPLALTVSPKRKSKNIEQYFSKIYFFHILGVDVTFRSLFLAHCCSLRIASLCRVFARFAMNWEVEAGTSIIHYS